MNRPKATFYPGAYHAFEQDFIENLNNQLNGISKPDGMFPPGMDAPFERPKPQPYTEEEILT